VQAASDWGKIVGTALVPKRGAIRSRRGERRGGDGVRERRAAGGFLATGDYHKKGTAPLLQAPKRRTCKQSYKRRSSARYLPSPSAGRALPRRLSPFCQPVLRRATRSLASEGKHDSPLARCSPRAGAPGDLQTMSGEWSAGHLQAVRVQDFKCEPCRDGYESAVTLPTTRNLADRCAESPPGTTLQAGLRSDVTVFPPPFRPSQRCRASGAALRYSPRPRSNSA